MTDDDFDQKESSNSMRTSMTICVSVDYGQGGP